MLICLLILDRRSIFLFIVATLSLPNGQSYFDLLLLFFRRELITGPFAFSNNLLQYNIEFLRRFFLRGRKYHVVIEPHHSATAQIIVIRGLRAEFKRCRIGDGSLILVC
jgi:hypothetical protein